MDQLVLNQVFGRFSLSWSVWLAGRPAPAQAWWNLCCHWASSGFCEEEGQSKAKYLSLLFLNSPPEGVKAVCVAGSERRRDGAMTEQGWIMEKTQDSTGRSQAHTLNKHKGEVHQEK